MIKSIISKVKNCACGKANDTDTAKVVCGCFNVTDQDVKNAVKNGARSFEEVQKVTKVGTGCGGCVESNKILVAQLIAKY